MSENKDGVHLGLVIHCSSGRFFFAVPDYSKKKAALNVAYEPCAVAVVYPFYA